MVVALYSQANASVSLNGQEGTTFKLQRPVRKGCSLAPYLYLLVGEILDSMLDDLNNELKDFTLLDSTKTTNQMFADDFVLHLEGTELNLNLAINILHTFCEASGAKINWDKSIGIWAARHSRTWEWQANLEMKWLEEGKSTRYLGFSIGFRVPEEEVGNKFLQQINNCLTH